MRPRLGIVLLVALPLAGMDLAVKAVVVSSPYAAHHRSPTWAAVSFGLFVVAVLAARLPSRLLAVALGVLAGGLLGNLVSGATHHRVVPNPFVAGAVAFNLADVFLLAGIVLVAVAAMQLALRFRELLPTHTIPVRLVRYVRARRAA